MTNAMKIASKGRAGFTSATEIASQGRLVGAGLRVVLSFIIDLAVTLKRTIDLESRL